jgi:NADP-dependent 3-hydroxy acid dehydrogenase YdfG
MVENMPADNNLALKASDIGDAVAYVTSTPDTVAVNEILIRPTKQEI